MKSDLELWQSAVKLLLSSTLILHKPLGEFLRPPLRHKQWYTSEDERELYLIRSDDACEVFLCHEDKMCCRRRTYERAGVITDGYNLAKYASVDTFDQNFVRLRSTAQRPREKAEIKKFTEVMKSWPNQSLWKYF